MRKLSILFAFFVASQAWAGIPATPVMTLYRFNGALGIPYYGIETFRKKGTASPAGTLAQGTSLIPCLVIRNGRPVTDARGTPYVGFHIVVDARKATPAATQKFRQALEKRLSLTVPNHHCDSSVRHVINVRNLFEMTKAPFFDPPVSAQVKTTGSQPQGELDQIIRAFHNSPDCNKVNRRLIGRRSALQQAWNRFVRNSQSRWSGKALQQARHLDYTMRTAIFEGHLDRGCNAYGACERNIIALSIRNRARESCAKYQGCRTQGDFQGVSSKVSQYNIWDEYLTQISGLTFCFLRHDLANATLTPGDESSVNTAYYAQLRGSYAQSLAQVQRILFGTDRDLRQVFPKVALRDLKSLRHYYHPPAMGKCFPNHERVEYMRGAVASKGQDFALIANTRIRVDERTDGGYFFHDFVFEQKPDRDDVTIVNAYPGFVVDGRKVSLKTASRCYPYGIPRGCRFGSISRYRKTPGWLAAGKSLELTCRVQDQGETCQRTGVLKTAKVGGVCDTEMRPVAGVK
jgi:hypothetical protein